MDESKSDQPKPYLLTEASGLTGLSVDALRKRILRRKLRAHRSNEDGLWRVWLTEADIETAKAGRLAGNDVDAPSEESRTISALEAEIGTLREALTRERERADRAGGGGGAGTGRRAGAGSSGRGGGKGLREALAEPRRPFWKRWLGR